ncbi:MULTISPECIES: L,D-transpeptidase [unclassified Phyllobacterium]|uniref:L,D-transpeptidase n=1 Tax=unclassified Phyllobacterium TaxID=2638441 RepID=UPI0030130B0A
MVTLKSGFGALTIILACLGSVGAGEKALPTEPSPPILDQKNHKVWIQQGYLDFLMEPESYPPRHARHGAVAVDRLQPAAPRSVVSYETHEKPGTIIIETENRSLYLVQGNGRALRYPVGVGREGYGWRGTERVSSKKEWPDWRPPSDMLARRPDLPQRMAGGPENPLGARALYLGDTLYRIHGSNEPESVGQSSSSGCFRMTNEDVVDLYRRVKIGTKVVVL